MSCNRRLKDIFAVHEEDFYFFMYAPITKTYVSSSREGRTVKVRDLQDVQPLKGRFLIFLIALKGYAFRLYAL